MKYKLIILITITAAIVFAQGVSANVEKVASSAFSTIIEVLLGTFIGALVTYYFSTKDMDDKLKKKVQEGIETHLAISHQDRVWDAIDKHKLDCGSKISNLEKISRKQELERVENRITLHSLVRTVDEIAKKLRVTPVRVNLSDLQSMDQDIGNPDDTGSVYINDINRGA